MTTFLVRYLIIWLALCLLALIFAFRTLRPEWRLEWALITVPWKLALFLPAILFVTFAGRFTNDETWDVVTGAGMSLLTFLTSAWAVGTAYKVLVGERPPVHLFIALVVALFASSWFYDGWLLLRDGAYTGRWLGNLMLSPIIYVSAGLLLNLERRGSGIGFAFTRSDWPAVHNAAASPWLALGAIPLVAIAAYVLIAFVRWELPFVR